MDFSNVFLSSAYGLFLIFLPFSGFFLLRQSILEFQTSKARLARARAEQKLAEAELAAFHELNDSSAPADEHR